MKKRILVVDDEPGIHASLQMTLEPVYEVLCASNAQEGLARFRQELPSLVLLDVVLPGSDGLGLLQSMRSEDPTVPVIMLTAVKMVKTRSEEHTSELQSQSNLVCRLLLEKKKIQ